MSSAALLNFMWCQTRLSSIDFFIIQHVTSLHLLNIVALTCVPLPTPTNGLRADVLYSTSPASGRYAIGIRADFLYGCRPGQQPTGFDPSICGPLGQWSRPSPECIGKIIVYFLRSKASLFKKNLENISPFYGATDTPVLGFWCLRVPKPEWQPYSYLAETWDSSVPCTSEQALVGHETGTYRPADEHCSDSDIV